MNLVAGEENSRSPFAFAQGRLSASLRSGRDDNSYLAKDASAQETAAAEYPR